MINISTNGGLSSTEFFYKNNHIDHIYIYIYISYNGNKSFTKVTRAIVTGS